jgi:hypothetical protein
MQLKFEIYVITQYKENHVSIGMLGKLDRV